MTQKDEGYLEVNVRLIGTEIVSFRLAVDDFRMKWAVLGLATTAALLYLAKEAKGVLL